MFRRLAVLFLAMAPAAMSISVVGEAKGFAQGMIGGGYASPDYPITTDELTSLLTDKQPRVIVLQ